MIGVYRTAPKVANKFVALLQNSSVGFLMLYRSFSWYANDCTIIYGYLLRYCPGLGINIGPYPSSCLHRFYQHRSYMSEIVRGGIFAR